MKPFQRTVQTKLYYCMLTSSSRSSKKKAFQPSTILWGTAFPSNICRRTQSFSTMAPILSVNHGTNTVLRCKGAVPLVTQGWLVAVSVVGNTAPWGCKHRRRDFLWRRRQCHSAAKHTLTFHILFSLSVHVVNTIAHSDFLCIHIRRKWREQWHGTLNLHFIIK